MEYHILRQIMAFLIDYTMLYMLNLKFNVTALILETWSQHTDFGAKKFKNVKYLPAVIVFTCILL